MRDQLERRLGLVREIEALGQSWHDWRQEEEQQRRAAQVLCGSKRQDPVAEIIVGREEFNVAGEVMVCLHPGCGGFVCGLVRRDSHVYWPAHCRCPSCGQGYLIRES